MQGFVVKYYLQSYNILADHDPSERVFHKMIEDTTKIYKSSRVWLVGIELHGVIFLITISVSRLTFPEDYYFFMF